MGDTVLYMRSSVPSEMVPALSDRFIEDFGEFANVDNDVFEAALTELVGSDSFLSRNDLRIVFGKVLDGPAADLFSRVVGFLHRIETDGQGIEDLFSKLAAVERDDKSSVATFTQERLSLLRDRVCRLKASWKGLDRQKKAENLSKANGRRLLNIQLICDLRPIFDEQRKEIEGWLPITTMHIVAEGADGLPDGIDVVLSASDVDTLATASGNAKLKLDVLRSVANRLNDPIPTTEITQ